MDVIEANYLMHHGVKGMKWGVRKKPDVSQSGTNFSYGTAKTRWGANRQRTKAHNKSIKSTYKQAKSDVKSGKISKESQEYKSARSARRKNLAGRAAAKVGGFGKANQGRYYAHRDSGKSVAESALRTYGNKAVKAAVVGTAVTIAGKAAVKSLINAGMKSQGINYTYSDLKNMFK